MAKHGSKMWDGGRSQIRMHFFVLSNSGICKLNFANYINKDNDVDDDVDVMRVINIMQVIAGKFFMEIDFGRLI